MIKHLLIIFFFISQNQSQQCGNIIFHSFDPVIVRLSLDSSNVQHEKLVFELVKPYIEGFSLSTKMEIDDVVGGDGGGETFNKDDGKKSPQSKRKSKETLESSKMKNSKKKK